MRLRRKKHLEERLQSCSDLIVYDITEYDGDIKAMFQSSKPLRMEIGCGKRAFILETAAGMPDTNFIHVELNL